MVYTHGNMERGKNSGHLWYEGGVACMVLRNMHGMVYTHGNMERGSALLRSVARTVVISDTRVVLPTQQELLFEIWPLCDLCQSYSHRRHHHHHLNKLFWIKTQLIIINIPPPSLLFAAISSSRCKFVKFDSTLDKASVWICERVTLYLCWIQILPMWWSQRLDLWKDALANLSKCNLIHQLIKPASEFVRGWFCWIQIESTTWSSVWICERMILHLCWIQISTTW